VNVDRTQVLAYRTVAQQLDNRVDVRPAELAVLDLGVQDTPYGSARPALAARTAAPLDDDSLVLVWSTRGAPHLHRRTDLIRLAAALWPLSDADAAKRIASSQVKQAAALGLAAFEATADAFGETVDATLPKGEVSAAVSARVPAALNYACRSCQATHIHGGLFQQAGLAGGVRLDLAGSTTRLTPIDGWPGRPSVAAGTDGLIRAYLRLLGPATPAEAAKFLGTTITEVRRAWPADLAEVRVAGRTAWLPAEQLDVLRRAAEPRMIRLLPPSDPYLQARDRNLLVPDRERQAEVWRILGNPGALLVDGEIAGTWRARRAGRSGLELTVRPFAPLSSLDRPDRSLRAGIEAEAERLAAARGADDVRVRLAE
jgi:hypothetical protein